MNADNKSVILAESSRLIGQIGNNLVLNLHIRIREIEALTRTIGALVEGLPKSEDLFQQILPTLINFQGDIGVAGGGVWPEPYAFSSERERRSFFWGRNQDGEFQYFDHYNQLAPGYHQEAWYVVGRYARPGQCVWSKSYMDRYSCQPMVTCTSPTFEQGQFTGVVTIDLKLENLQNTAESWRKRTGGYVFILDQLNKFITFPQPSLVKKAPEERGNCQTEDLMLINEFVQKEPLFEPIAAAVDEMSQAIIRQAKEMPHFKLETAAEIERSGHHINPSEAELIAAVMMSPFKEVDRTTYLYKTISIENDFLLKEVCTVFLFHVPRAYWKIVVVKPFSEAAIETYSVIQSEKRSSLGQLVAGVAHEINNPINYIYGNIDYANAYIKDLLELIDLYQQHYPDANPDIQQYLETKDYQFLILDLPKILSSMRVGADRIRQIVLSLRNFAQLDETAVKAIDLHENIDNTLLLLEPRLKAKGRYPGVEVIRNYDNLPLVECYPSPLNQVFMNILINALDALEEEFKAHQAMIASTQLELSKTLGSTVLPEAIDAYSKAPFLQIKTEIVNGSHVAIHIIDNGPGIPDLLQKHLFDPFFTTKPAGKGTGLGLAICHQIVTEKHAGNLRCFSTVGQGTEFLIEIPIRVR
ncbi:MAG: ATP-binding protein [Oculatellaceae cyanobacterium bins.114]|nr:ATP-binding protein [Oculatellaceae cyanobacterium bins.114]